LVFLVVSFLLASPPVIIVNYLILKTPSSGMWRCVDLMRTDVSKERMTSIFRVINPRARNQREQVAAVCSRFTKDLHKATSQKTAFFIVTTVKTSNLTYLILNYIVFLSETLTEILKSEN
jgi:hypothetical protein